MPQELFSVEQVAERLGLHVRTVRGYVRDGKLPAVRIGKQYRIARDDLERLTGRPAEPDRVRRQRHVEVSSIVAVDAIAPDDAHRITTTVLASIAGPRDGQPLRVESHYDEERATLKLIVLGAPGPVSDVLSILSTLVQR